MLLDGDGLNVGVAVNPVSALPFLLLSFQSFPLPARDARHPRSFHRRQRTADRQRFGIAEANYPCAWRPHTNYEVAGQISGAFTGCDDLRLVKWESQCSMATLIDRIANVEP